MGQHTFCALRASRLRGPCADAPSVCAGQERLDPQEAQALAMPFTLLAMQRPRIAKIMNKSTISMMCIPILSQSLRSLSSSNSSGALLVCCTHARTNFKLLFSLVYAAHHHRLLKKASPFVQETAKMPASTLQKRRLLCTRICAPKTRPKMDILVSNDGGMNLCR